MFDDNLDYSQPFPFLVGNNEDIEDQEDWENDAETYERFFEILDYIFGLDVDADDSNDLVAIVKEFQELMLEATAKLEIEVSFTFMEMTDEDDEELD